MVRVTQWHWWGHPPAPGAGTAARMLFHPTDETTGQVQFPPKRTGVPDRTVVTARDPAGAGRVRAKSGFATSAAIAPSSLPLLRAGA